MLEKEFEPHYTAYKADPSPTNASALLKAVDPVMRSAFRTYTGQDAVGPKVRSKAKQIVLDSVDSYDPTRAKLRTHLMTNLQGLRRASANERQMIRLPERVALDQHWLHVSEKELEDKLGRAPSDAEMSEHSGVSMKRIGHIRKASPVMATGTVEAVQEGGGMGVPAVKTVGTEDDHWLNFVYQDLHPIDQTIMEHVIGMNGKPRMQKNQIAAKLRLSPSAVSQRVAKIQAMIDERNNLSNAMF